MPQKPASLFNGHCRNLVRCGEMQMYTRIPCFFPNSRERRLEKEPLRAEMSTTRNLGVERRQSGRWGVACAWGAWGTNQYVISRFSGSREAARLDESSWQKAELDLKSSLAEAKSRWSPLEMRSRDCPVSDDDDGRGFVHWRERHWSSSHRSGPC